MKKYITTALIIAAILALATACNTERRVNDWSIKNPDKFKQLAAVLAPCIEVNPKSDTLYQTKTDTLVTPGETIIERRNDTVFVTKKLPGKTITKTEVQTVTKTVADSRAVEACAILNRQKDEHIIKLQTEQKATKKNRNNWRLAFFGLIGVIALWIAFKVWGGSVLGWAKGLVK